MNESRLFVGNLSYQTMENDLQEYFSQAGVVTSVNLMLDKFTGKSRGFAFVEYATAAEAKRFGDGQVTLAAHRRTGNRSSSDAGGAKRRACCGRARSARTSAADARAYGGSVPCCRGRWRAQGGACSGCRSQTRRSSHTSANFRL